MPVVSPISVCNVSVLTWVRINCTATKRAASIISPTGVCNVLVLTGKLGYIQQSVRTPLLRLTSVWGVVDLTFYCTATKRVAPLPVYVIVF